MDANDDHGQERRLQELLGRALDGACSDADLQEFHDALKQTPRLALGYLDEIFVHNLLTWQSEDITECIDLEVAANEELAANERRSAAADGTPVRAQRARNGLTWALAASLLVGGGAALWLASSDNGAPQLAGAIAEIVDEDGVFWSNSSTALRDGRLIYLGKLESNAGAYTLKFRSGPTMNVAGGSSLLIESDMLVRLDRGQATAHVPPSGVGFTIRTPVVNVIDQGTEFGVAVGERGNTDVVVFEGKVDLEESLGADAGAKKQLNRGEGVSITPQGVVGRLMQIQRNLDWGWWTASHPDTESNVIKEVSDNIPTSDGTKYYCYQITFHGLHDDAFAYADHPHQWNGLTAAGLPRFLRGADFVATFNDYRYMNQLQMTVRLSQPANLYVFFDDRVPVPDWLRDEFQDTGVDIGLDEGPWPKWDKDLRPDLPEKVNAVGGGQSIDNSFSVWRRRCEDAGFVTLGPVGASSEARAMYGVAATPLD